MPCGTVAGFSAPKNSNQTSFGRCWGKPFTFAPFFSYFLSEMAFSAFFVDKKPEIGIFTGEKTPRETMRSSHHDNTIANFRLNLRQLFEEPLPTLPSSDAC